MLLRYNERIKMKLLNTISATALVLLLVGCGQDSLKKDFVAPKNPSPSTISEENYEKMLAELKKQYPAPRYEIYSWDSVNNENRTKIRPLDEEKQWSFFRNIKETINARPKTKLIVVIYDNKATDKDIRGKAFLKAVFCYDYDDECKKVAPLAFF